MSNIREVDWSIPEKISGPHIRTGEHICKDSCESRAREKIESWWRALKKLVDDNGGYHFMAKALYEEDIQTPEQRWDKFGLTMLYKVHENALKEDIK